MLQIILGIFLADVVAGLAHWFEDTYIDYCTTIPGLSHIGKENELHHYFPRAMLNGSYFKNMRTTMIIAIIVYIVLYLFIPSKFKKYPVFFVTFFMFLCLSNLFHRFSHQRECETHPIILQLQKMEIICSHEHHRQHHIANAHERYCTSFSINNYILDNIYFWRILEMIIGIFGVKPNRKPVYEHYEPIHNYMHTDAKNECPKRPTDMDKKILIKNLENHIKCY